MRDDRDVESPFPRLEHAELRARSATCGTPLVREPVFWTTYRGRALQAGTIGGVGMIKPATLVRLSLETSRADVDICRALSAKQSDPPHRSLGDGSEVKKMGTRESVARDLTANP